MVVIENKALTILTQKQRRVENTLGVKKCGGVSAQ
jgi:hypothetical protein